MAPMPKEDIDAIAEAFMARHKSAEVPANGTSHPAVEHPEPEPKSWWQRTKVPLAAAAGVLVAVSGGILTWGIAWGGTQHEITVIKADVAQVKVELTGKADAAPALERETRLREVEKDNAASNAANTADHTAIKKDVVEVKADVKEVRAAQVEQDKKLDRILARMPKQQ